MIWSFLYGTRHGSVELILDNAPARSAELLGQDRVDAALVPVIAFQQLDGLRLISDVCVGARERVRSVCLVTKGMDLADVRSVGLDVSSKTSVILIKIIFREFLGFDPTWHDAEPDVEAMLDKYDAALLIGDPALRISNAESLNAECGMRNAELLPLRSDVPTDIPERSDSNSAFRGPHSAFKDSAFQKFDLAEMWKEHTGLGFVFAMWMTRRSKVDIDFAGARDEGLEHLSEIVSNYESEIRLGRDELELYLSENISYRVDESMRSGMELYFKLAAGCGLIESARPLRYLE